MSRRLRMTGLLSLTFIDFVRNIHLFLVAGKRVDEKLHFKTVSERLKLFLIKNWVNRLCIFLEALFARMILELAF